MPTYRLSLKGDPFAESLSYLDSGEEKHPELNMFWKTKPNKAKLWVTESKLKLRQELRNASLLLQRSWQLLESHRAPHNRAGLRRAGPGLHSRAPGSACTPRLCSHRKLYTTRQAWGARGGGASRQGPSARIIDMEGGRGRLKEKVRERSTVYRSWWKVGGYAAPPRMWVAQGPGPKSEDQANSVPRCARSREESNYPSALQIHGWDPL